jgi:hypothetical protein
MAIGEEILPKVKVNENPPDQRELGADMNMPFSATFRNQWELLRQDDVSVEKLVAMRKTDGQARALYRLITYPILSTIQSSSIVPANGKKGGLDEAKFIEQMLFLPPHSGGMEIPFRKVVEHFLLAIFDGFSAAELVVHAPQRGLLKGKWTIKKIAPRPAETLSFVFDKKGQMEGIRQRVYVNNTLKDVVIPKDRALYFAANEVENPYYGQSYFLPAFFHWDKKVRLYYLGHKMVQRSAVGHYPKNADPKKVRNFIKQISDLGTNQWMAVEEFFEVDSLKEGSNTDVLGLINHHNSQMSKSVLADFLDESQGAGQNEGSFVDFGKQSDALFQLMLEAIIGDLEDLINYKIIPNFIDWNFGNDMYPKFRFGPVSKDQRGIVVDLFKSLMLAANQGNVSKHFIREAERKTSGFLDFSLDYDSIKKEWEEQDIEEERQRAKMEAMQDAQMQIPSTTATGAMVDQALDLPEGLLPESFLQ